VAVETRPDLGPDSAEAQAAAKLLTHEIKTYIGTSARIELRPCGGIERSLGKAKRVLDLRKPV
jgi:phenylacetate-CoA ligase